MLNSNYVLEQIQKLTDDDFIELTEYADRAIYAEEVEMGFVLFFPREQYEPMDVVLLVINDMLLKSESNKFDPNKGDFKTWVRGAITFKVKNLIRKKSNQEQSVENNQDGENEQNEGIVIVVPDSPEILRMKEEYSEKFWIFVYSLVGQDKELAELVKALEDGNDLKKSQELALVLGWEMAKVENAKKRFMRKINKSKEEFRSIS